VLGTDFEHILYLMLKIVRTVLSGVPLIALPAFAAEGALQTGITSVGPAKFLFTLAAALLFLFTLAAALFLTLIFRSTANHLARFITARIGQWRIRTALAKRSPDVLHDFILPGAYGGLAKIDHALLTAGGVLCIQTKHYSGVVFGGEDEAQWTNVDGVKRQRFLNPLIQNEGRARALCRSLISSFFPDPLNSLRHRQRTSFTSTSWKATSLNSCLAPAKSMTGTPYG